MQKIILRKFWMTIPLDTTWYGLPSLRRGKIITLSMTPLHYNTILEEGSSNPSWGSWLWKNISEERFDWTSSIVSLPKLILCKRKGYLMLPWDHYAINFLEEWLSNHSTRHPLMQIPSFSNDQTSLLYYPSPWEQYDWRRVNQCFY